MSLPEPYYQDEAVTIYHGDCREILPLLPKVDLVLTDPPYGIQKWDWDEHYPDGFELECLRLADTVAIMCGQWAIPKCVRALGESYIGIIALHNRNGMTYSPLGFGNWIPCIVAGHRPKSGQDLLLFNVTGDKPSHPSPKPIAAMNRIIERLSKEGMVILDPFMGSGTTLRAAKNLNRKAIGIEIEEKYCEIAARRMGQGVLC
jgi:DNA modification methylase